MTVMYADMSLSVSVYKYYLSLCISSRGVLILLKFVPIHGALVTFPIAFTIEA